MIRLESVLKISLQDVLKMSERRLQNVLKTSLRCFEELLKASRRRLNKMSWKCLEDVLKTYGQDEYIGIENVFWRRKAKANIFLKKKTKDVFKTSSMRLHQDECLLDYFTEHLSLTTFVLWILQSQSIIYSIYSAEVVRESNLCWLSGKVISIRAWYWRENFTNNSSCRTEQIVRGTDVIIFDT